MTSLPLLHSLDVESYGLYPGASPGEGLHLHFEPGLTLVLGANGLGKTTLVTMLYRMLTGPADISALARSADLGNASLAVTWLQGRRRRLFAERVADHATSATAKLIFDVGDQRVSIERNLRDLTLRSLEVGSSTLTPDESGYQAEMARLAGVSSFSDWILLLRYIVFYFERRRSLVWDPTAQRQLLRILFLNSADAKDWADREREILQTDTRMRNVRAVATSEDRALANDESRATTEPETRQDLERLSGELDAERTRLDEVNSTLSELEVNHERSRLRLLTLEQERESIYRELERAQLVAIGSRFPRQSDSARYILAQILTESECLACGRNVPGFAKTMEDRISGHECVICGTYIGGNDTNHPTDLTLEQVSQREDDLARSDRDLEAARNAAQEAEAERGLAVSEIRRLQTEIAERTALVERLLDSLPPEVGDLRKRRQELAALRARVEVLQSELKDMLDSFEQVIADANATVAEQAAQVQEVFERYARRFLFEDCGLTWAPNRAQLGQSGQHFDFPAFGLELGGSDFSGTVRRDGPEDVSESQREFIDVSFRMALAEVATDGGVTSLVMDAPESSLDAVFVERAASVLGTFGQVQANNRLVVTSNLIAGELIPELLRQAAPQGDRAGRVVDLLAVARPTAAITQFRGEYETARDELLTRAEASD